MLDRLTINVIGISVALNIIVFAIGIYVLAARYRAPAYHIMMIYNIYFFIGFIVRPIEIIQYGYSNTWNYIGLIPDVPTLLWAGVMIAIAHIAIMLGFFVVAAKHGGVAKIKPFEFVPRRVVAFSICALIFLCLAAYSSSVEYGSATSLEGGRLAITTAVDSQGGIRLVDVSGYQTVFEEWLPLTLIMLFMWKRTRTLAIVLICSYVFYRTLVGSGRQKFALLVLAIAVLVMIERGLRYPPVRILVLGAFIFTLFNVIGSDRLIARRILAGEVGLESLFTAKDSTADSVPFTEYISEYDAFTAFSEVIPDKTGYSFGTQYLRLMIWPIPRAIWPTKPIYTLIFDPNDYGNFSFLTTTLFMDSYMVLGVCGLFPILFGISYLLNNFYQNVTRRPSALNIMIYISLAQCSPLLFRDGVVGGSYSFLVSSLGAVIICTAGKITLYQSAPSRTRLVFSNQRRSDSLWQTEVCHDAPDCPSRRFRWRSGPPAGPRQ